ncbi:LrgB family protein [Alkalibacterium olivapovliticus]|uniref:Putative murein hydrolase (TIGR00659 family) n=1 Tax=Alkalibacterium olivapovliticus TaxID=99907 RepID=A0A2T0W3R6_9LACT|nr:LrgB family protein [Alkalibacterium olivapovliticus]PRY80100.1 putative murein hydrolase (TIGR00659 family) [Alkalibacterium olivapovliticus]
MIRELTSSPFFGIVLSVALYLLGQKLHRKWPIPIFTPLVFAIVMTIVLLLLMDISYETYFIGGQYINIWVTPATVALAIKLKKNIEHLRANVVAILSGIGIGVVFHTLLIVALSLIFQFNEELAATLFPKSVTTAIALGVSESLGGIASLTVAVVVFTGVLGAVVGPSIFKWLKITDPVAQGVAMGSGSHAMGTTKAIEMGEVQGAMSGLSIVLTGIAVVILAPFGLFLIQLLF